MVGTVGRLLGDASVNIAGMQVSRDRQGGRALVVMAVDSAVPSGVAEEVRAAMTADWVRRVDLAPA
jgi:D-3-phosphoglycerate dehydrogenase / 2-oxoglutarate reductase